MVQLPAAARVIVILEAGLKVDRLVVATRSLLKSVMDRRKIACTSMDPEPKIAREHDHTTAILSGLCLEFLRTLMYFYEDHMATTLISLTSTLFRGQPRAAALEHELSPEEIRLSRRTVMNRRYATSTLVEGALAGVHDQLYRASRGVPDVSSPKARRPLAISWSKTQHTIDRTMTAGSGGFCASLPSR